MLISFFEEFPTPHNLAKLKYITWRSKLYLAASSFMEFQNLTGKISNPLIKIVYWPVLKQNEGYWISPFSERKALLRIFKELSSQKIPVMLDLELPNKNRLPLYFNALTNFKFNQQLIQHFINNYPGQIYLAEYHLDGWKGKILQGLGLHYPNPKVKIIKMIYHSLHYFSKDELNKKCLQGKARSGSNFCVGLGTTAVGINNNEPILTTTQLKSDLRLVKKCGVKESIIFRLAGLSKLQAKMIKELAQGR